MLIKGIYTDVNGNQILTNIAVSALGQILTSSVAPSSIVATLRVLNSRLIIGVAPVLGASLQAAYDAELGLQAPDSVPAAVVSAANSLNNTNFKIYLGQNQWYYTNNTNGNTAANWLVFNGGKSNFGVTVLPNHIFTFK